MQKITLLFILFFGFVMNAQIISGKILSNEDQKPIPYAKISLENEDFGTIADENGNFRIDLTDIDKTKNLKIEVGGYEKFSTPVFLFLKDNKHTIFLKEKFSTIEEVKINPKKYVNKNWG
jgi:hypothetical protein